MLEYSIEEDYINSLKTQDDVISLLMKHSFESFVFSVRTAEFNYALSREMGFDKVDSEKYFMCGLYHDVGKIGMSKFLIDYPARYSEDMREEMKKHTVGGSRLLELTNADKLLIETARYHHCNFDGSGYMYNLAGKEIPFHARLTRISDSADAYLSTRSYKPGYVVSGLYEDLAQFSNTWYDPDIITMLKRVHDRVIKESGSDTNQDEYMYHMKRLYEINNTAEEHLFKIIRNV